MTERSMRMLADLDEKARPKFEDMLARLDKELGEERYIAFEGRRSVKKQEAYHAQGREPLEKVNALRQEAGLYLLRSEQDNYMITWTLKSVHVEGLAMDIVPTDGAGEPTWDLAHFWSAYETIRNCGRAAGLECGADWPAPKTDWPHYQIK